MVRYLESSLSEIEVIWNTTGISAKTRNVRCCSMLTNFRALFDDVIAEERKRQQEIRDAVERHRASISKISDELGLPQPAEVRHMTSFCLHYFCMYIAHCVCS